jgi:hypothetical protein
MKKQIASLAVILLAVSSLSFYGCGGENEGNIGAEDPEDTGEDVGGDESEDSGGNAEVGESGEAGGEDE